jgi:ATP-dependent protease ClpP protease subunit
MFFLLSRRCSILALTVKAALAAPIQSHFVRTRQASEMLMAKIKSKKRVPEIPIIGDVDDWESETIKTLLETPEQGECVFYVDSAGGSVYGALAVITLLRIRQIKATIVVLSECSSAALLLFAACPRRFVTPYSIFLFHRMRWQSEKRIAAEEAEVWARHFTQLEAELDDLQGKLFGTATNAVRKWIRDGSYVSGRQIAEAGLAELLDL